MNNLFTIQNYTESWTCLRNLPTWEWRSTPQESPSPPATGRSPRRRRDSSAKKSIVTILSRESGRRTIPVNIPVRHSTNEEMSYPYCLCPRFCGNKKRGIVLDSNGAARVLVSRSFRIYITWDPEICRYWIMTHEIQDLIHLSRRRMQGGICFIICSVRDLYGDLILWITKWERMKGLYNILTRINKCKYGFGNHVLLI